MRLLFSILIRVATSVCNACDATSYDALDLRHLNPSFRFLSPRYTCSDAYHKKNSYYEALFSLLK